MAASESSSGNEELKLSSTALLALKQHAEQLGFVFDAGNDSENALDCLSEFFALSQEQREDIFDVEYSTSSLDWTKMPVRVCFSVKGVKRELGQTLDSTGLTM
jgi:hypothetical protein